MLELLSGLVAAEEGARGQLAAELHDTVAQSLMTARGMLAGGASTPSQLAMLGDYVEDAEEQLRAVMARTRPPALRDGDLASAVSGLRSDMRMRYAVEVHLDWPDTACPLPLVAAVTVYRFFQEALLNVVKHADVDEAHVVLELEPDAVVARVRDEGPGFDPAAVRPVGGRHVGLGLLRERARLAGGSLEVWSGDEGGTTLTLRLPRPADGPVEVAAVPAVPAVPDAAGAPAVAGAAVGPAAHGRLRRVRRGAARWCRAAAGRPSRRAGRTRPAGGPPGRAGRRRPAAASSWPAPRPRWRPRAPRAGRSAS